MLAEMTFGSSIDSSNLDELNVAWTFEIEASTGYGGMTATPLILGDAGQIPADVMNRLRQQAWAVVGPRASRHSEARVTIDTGVAGIHVGGTAVRMDDVPLPLRPAISGHRDPADVLRALIDVADRTGARDARSAR